MAGETNLSKLLKGMTPKLNEGSYVFVTVADPSVVERSDTLCEFKEAESTTLIIKQQKADELLLKYDYVASWISLEIHSSLDAVGLTAAFSNALAEHNISCNVVAAYYHDHIFVNKNDAEKAMNILSKFSD